MNVKALQEELDDALNTNFLSEDSIQFLLEQTKSSKPHEDYLNT